MPEPSAEKARLRRDLKRRLAALEPAFAREAAARVARHALALPALAEARGVLAYLSFGAELDTRDLIEALLASNRAVYVPRTVRRDTSLALHRYPCPLETLACGLRQPPADAPALGPEAIDGTIDLALVPGLAFDRRGHRLGYGAGYFDRFLAGRPFPTIGLGYACQLLDRLPAEPHDVPLSTIVTENGPHPGEP